VNRRMSFKLKSASGNLKHGVDGVRNQSVSLAQQNRNI
jgi:hypothetical protein